VFGALAAEHNGERDHKTFQLFLRLNRPRQVVVAPTFSLFFSGRNNPDLHRFMLISKSDSQFVSRSAFIGRYSIRSRYNLPCLISRNAFCHFIEQELVDYDGVCSPPSASAQIFPSSATQRRKRFSSAVIERFKLSVSTPRSRARGSSPLYARWFPTSRTRWIQPVTGPT